MARNPIKKRDPVNLPGRADPGGYELDDTFVMSFGDHLEDLRKRVFLAIIGIIPIFAIAFGFGRTLLRLIIEPAQTQLIKAGEGAQLISTSPVETFSSVIKIALIVTVLVGAPWILYQLWRFISPGLYKHERRVVHLLLPFSGLLTIGSVLFLYYVILPVILAFFIAFGARVSGEPSVPVAPIPEGIVMPTIPVLEADPEAIEQGMMWINQTSNQLRVCYGFEEDGTPIIRLLSMNANVGISPMYKISEYIKTVLSMGLAFGIAFQTPVVVVMLGWVGIINPRTMRKYRKHALGVSVILGAVLTPADPLSMILLAGPLYLLYELGLFILQILPIERVVGKNPMEAAQDPSAVTDEDAGEG
jgi:sec-independent protein translocase protein TatC